MRALLVIQFLCVTVVTVTTLELRKTPFKLTILHTNDIHARFLETNEVSGGCSDKEHAEKKCFGGFSRLHYKVNEIRRKNPNVIYLSGGDYFQGTVWYTLYKWEIVARFVNKLGHTAMTLGNHEFDDGLNGLIPFLDNVTFPIVSANINTKKEPKMKILKSVVVEKGGQKIGIIGYTTPDTAFMSKPETLEFDDIKKSVTAEAQRLHDEGIKILIAIGHAGYAVDLDVATVPHIDVVVGGHTNTFLYSGKAPHLEEPVGEYPTVITTNGRRVPVIQAYAFGKYLGYLDVTFDDNGEVKAWAGNPILLDGSIPQDKAMETELHEAGKEVFEKIKKEVGKTHVFLEGNAAVCRMKECNLGNVIAEGMVHMNLQFADEKYWSDVSLSILNGGAVRSSIDAKNRNGVITLEDVLTVLPFENTIDLIEIKGKHLRETFEFSVKDYDVKGHQPAGKFLQVSGLRVEYDINRPNGQRVIDLQALCQKCRIPEYQPVQEEEIYKVALPTFLVTGGDGYKVIQDNVINYHASGTLDSDVLLEYLNSRSPIIQGIDGRVKFIDSAKTDPKAENGCNRLISTLQFTSVQAFLLLSLFYVIC